MKKTMAILAALVMVFAAVAALAEEPAAPVFAGGVQFDMDMEQVMEIVNLPNHEFEDVATGDGYIVDVKYLFVGNGLVAIHYDMADGTSYEAVKAQLTAVYGEAVPFDAAKIGNGRFVIDDDGDVKDCREMIEADGVTFVLGQDRDGDVDVTILDPTAAYINN